MPTPRARRWPTTWCCALAFFGAAGCGGSTTSAADGGLDATTQHDAGADDAPGRAVIEIYVEGDATPKSYADGYSGQTPRDLYLGLQRFELLRSLGDSLPVKVFDVSPSYLEVEMSAKSLVGVGRTPDIPAGTYTHGRVLLTMARSTVDVTAHTGALSLAGTMTILDAISDATIDGTPYAKGQCQLTFVSGGVTNTQASTLPPLPSTAGGTIVDEGPRTWMVFPFPTPLAIDPTDSTTHQATITYEIFESFRWEEKQLTDYTNSVWDVSANIIDSEVVKNFGATGYRIETL
jgi:hypothetical protein